MSLNNITSANASAVLVVAGLYENGIELQQFATDNSFSMDELTLSESRMGVDGKMASGYTPSVKVLTFNFEASSPSVEAISNLVQAMQTNKTLYECTITITIPSISTVYTYSSGVLTSGKVVPDSKKMLDPVNYKFTFQDFKKSLI